MTKFVSWVEQQVARERAAIAFLDKHGFAVSRVDRDGGRGGSVASYWVSGWLGHCSGADVIAIATQHGFGADAPAVEPAPVVAPAPPEVITEEEDMGEKRAITFTAEGPMLAAIEARAKADGISLARAAMDFIDKAIIRGGVETNYRFKIKDEEPLDDHGALGTASLEELLDEIAGRFVEADNAEALAQERARADAAEARITALREALAG